MKVQDPKVVHRETVTADGDGDAFRWTGGQGVFQTSGDFDSGTLALQFSNDDNNPTNWETPTNGSHTQGDATKFDLGPCWLRLSMSGVAAASSVIAQVARPGNSPQ